jgi:hypothetical protein
MNNETQSSIDLRCKNCNHAIVLHKPNCTFVDNENEDIICDCNKAQYYNSLISGKYIGWAEIHCNSCGKLLGFIDSTLENIFDYTILCPVCIVKTTFESSNID